MKRIKNNTEETQTWEGQEILSGEYYTIQEVEASRWANSSPVLSAIGSGDAVMNDGTDDVTDVAEAINLIKDLVPKPVQTLSEVKELRLQGIALSGIADPVTGIAMDTVTVPETGVTLGRYTSWGELWTTKASHKDDKIIGIQILVPESYGLGDTVASGYLDEDSPKGGWWIPFKPAMADVETIGYIGFLPGGFRLRIIVQFGGTPEEFAGNEFRCNIGWGKRDAS